MANDGLGGGPDDVGLFEFLAAGDGDYGQFGGEAFHMLGLLLQKALRNQEREVDVLVIGGFEPVVEFALDQFPNGISVGFDNHAALDDFGGFRHVALKNDILIPGGKVLAARRDWRFGHNG